MATLRDSKFNGELLDRGWHDTVFRVSCDNFLTDADMTKCPIFN